MEEGGKAPDNAQGGDQAPHNAQGGDQRTVVDSIDTLTQEMKDCKLWVQMSFQVAPCNEENQPPFTVPVSYRGNLFAVFTSVDPKIDVIDVWGAKTQDPKYKARPKLDDHEDMYQACLGMAIKDSAKNFADQTKNSLLTHTSSPTKVEVLQYACLMKLIPEGHKPDKQSTKVKLIEAADKVTTKLPKARCGHVDVKADVDAVPPVVGMAELVVSRHRAHLRAGKLLEQQYQLFAAAIAASAAGGGGVSSDKETKCKAKNKETKYKAKNKAAAAGGGASSGKEGKAAAGGGGAAAVADKDDDDVADKDGVGKRARRQ